MLDNPVAKRTAIAAGIGALIAIPAPCGADLRRVVGGAYGFFNAPGLVALFPPHQGEGRRR
jgi:DMSO/TMAO reductase YedYZ molybdopterin-dependent catalytic subunit